MNKFFKHQFLDGAESALSYFFLFLYVLISAFSCFILTEVYTVFKDAFGSANVDLPLITNSFLTIPLFVYYSIFILASLFSLAKEFYIKDRKRALTLNIYFSLASIVFIFVFVMSMYFPMFEAMSTISKDLKKH